MSSSLTETGTVDVLMPQMGTSVFEGTVIAWLRQVGETIEAEAAICEVSTDKIDTECPSPASGTIVEILVPEGETVEVGTVLARIASGEGASPSTGEAAAAPASPAASAAEAPAPSARASQQSPDGQPRYSPLVRRMAAEHDLDLATVNGSGLNGRVTKKDVMEAVAAGAAAPALLHSDSPYRPDPPAPTAGQSAADALAAGLGGVASPLSRIRQSIGSAMLESQRVAATCHTVAECDMSRIEARRRELGLTALPIVARATIETLREYPDLNATLSDTTITRFERVHLGIAVSLGGDGLIVPVIHDAQELSAEGLGARIKDLAKRARAKELSADEVRGATFTITNPVQFGALLATPVINQPQVAILDLEAVVKRPVVLTGPDGDDQIAIRPIVNLVLGWDHRAMDGVYAASFLGALRERLESL